MYATEFVVDALVFRNQRQWLSERVYFHIDADYREIVGGPHDQATPLHDHMQLPLGGQAEFACYGVAQKMRLGLEEG